MKYKETCQCCDSVVVAYTHNLNKPLVSALRQLVDFYEVKRVPANLQKNLSLTKNQYNNFQKLQHFDLVIRTEKGYYPTVYGIEFIKGEALCKDTVASMGNKSISFDHPAWKTTNKRPTLVSVKDIDISSYKQRSEYQEEKSSQTKLL